MGLPAACLLQLFDRHAALRTEQFEKLFGLCLFPSPGLANWRLEALAGVFDVVDFRFGHLSLLVVGDKRHLPLSPTRARNAGLETTTVLLPLAVKSSGNSSILYILCSAANACFWGNADLRRSCENTRSISPKQTSQHHLPVPAATPS